MNGLREKKSCPLRVAGLSPLTFYEFELSMLMGFSVRAPVERYGGLALNLRSTNEAKQWKSEDQPRNCVRVRKFRFNPSKVGFLALAVAVFVSGTAAKLSRLHRSTDPVVRVSVAKLWLETRSARTVTDVLRRVSLERPPAAVHANAVRPFPMLVDLGDAEHGAPRLPLLEQFIPQAPSRSPPFLRFCLA